jgi:hypothetical protein
MDISRSPPPSLCSSAYALNRARSAAAIALLDTTFAIGNNDGIRMIGRLRAGPVARWPGREAGPFLERTRNQHRQPALES